MKSVNSVNMDQHTQQTLTYHPIGSRQRNTVATHTPSSKTNLIPSAFYCPLTLSIMRDPVIDTEGYSYERAAIQEWLSRASRSPITRKPMRTSDLIPNRYLKDAIAETVNRTGRWNTPAATTTTTTTTTTRSDERRGSASSSIPNERQTVSTAHHQKHTPVHLVTPLGKKLSLDGDGIATFKHRHLDVTVEIPQHADDAEFWICTELPVWDLARRHPDLFKFMAKLNYMQAETRGGCLSVDPVKERVVYSYTGRTMRGGGVEDYFQGVLEDFLDCAVVLHEELSSFICGLDGVEDSCLSGKKSGEDMFVGKKSCSKGYAKHDSGPTAMEEIRCEQRHDYSEVVKKDAATRKNIDCSVANDNPKRTHSTAGTRKIDDTCLKMASRKEWDGDFESSNTKLKSIHFDDYDSDNNKLKSIQFDDYDSDDQPLKQMAKRKTLHMENNQQLRSEHNDYDDQHFIKRMNRKRRSHPRALAVREQNTFCDNGRLEFPKYKKTKIGTVRRLASLDRNGNNTTETIKADAFEYQFGTVKR